ncbi:Coiled-coil domain-containing protein 97 [Podila horticola]|nr:Coiled-coil domain-containing protein 97 [Podila horticola]
MTLPQESIESILTFLDPHLDTLETGFPTSSRPNEPALTSAQKRDKISATLASSPGIFLTRWGSVILYPRPESLVNDATASSKTPQDILELFAPLQNDYEVKYQLNRLFQQLHRINERRQFEQRSTHHQDPISSSTTKSPTSPVKHLTSPIDDEDRQPEPAQSDLFNRTALSQNTRRNRRLNYLLRHLAPPDNESSSSRPMSSDAKTATDKAHPTVATILSISGSMSNLSFADSTYFSDAEMEARAPELYQQYIGRFMDDDNENERDDDDDDEDNEDDDEEGGYADDEREQVKPFGKEVGLVDRILWNIDHPSKHQLKLERQERKDHQNQYQEEHHGESNGAKNEFSVPRPVPPKEVSEEEPVEEFDTESENEEDTEMSLKDSATAGKAKEVDQDSHRGPLAYVPDSEIYDRTSVTPRLPPNPMRPDLLSSMMASAAFSLEQPEERAIFAEVENGNDDSEQGEEDEQTEHRKEDQEALRREFVLLMKQRFLDGLDSNFDYSSVDFNEDLDDLDQEAHDEEDRYFDAEDELDDEGSGTSMEMESDDGSRRSGLRATNVRSSAYFASAPHPYASKHAHQDLGGMNYDERLASWESRPQNGAGDYDY